MRTSHHKAKKSMLGVKKSSQTMKKTRKKECPLGEMRTKSGCKNAQDRLEALLRQLSPSTNIVWRRNAGRVAATKGKPKSAVKKAFLKNKRSPKIIKDSNLGEAKVKAAIKEVMSFLKKEAKITPKKTSSSKQK